MLSYIVFILVFLFIGFLIFCYRISKADDAFSKLFEEKLSIRKYEKAMVKQNKLFYEFCFDIDGNKKEIKHFDSLTKVERTDIFIEIKICNINHFPLYYFNSLSGYFVLIEETPKIKPLKDNCGKIRNKFKLAEQGKKAVHLSHIYNFRAFLSHNKDFISMHFDNDTVLHFPREKLRMIN